MLNIPSQLLKGQIKVEVLDHCGRIVESRPWQRNLWLDQGLNRIAAISICKAFEYCAKGTGTTPTTEAPAGSNHYTLASGTITRTAGVRDFTAADIGKLLRFDTAGYTGYITSVSSVTVATIDNVTDTEAGSNKTITIYAVDQVGLDAEADRTGNYGASASDNSTVTASNVRTFKRSFIFDAETADTSYQEFGFSDIATAGNNLNVRVLLSAPLAVLGPTGGNPGNQIKVTYQLELTVTPATSIASATAGIVGMASSQAGHYTIETFATSYINADGTTNISLPDLEPYYDGSMGISSSTVALAPLGNKVRDDGDYVPLMADAYVDGDFSKTYRGSFGVNDAIGTSWRNLMIFNPPTGQAIFTYQFTNVFNKVGTKSLLLVFRKNWNRSF